ncbi:MAG TPA: energy transducer TonB [Acidobacteriaceae bacterium]|jgi:TonB family protein
MPTERISVNTSFGLLDDDRNRWRSFATSMVTNVTILILLLIIGAIHHQVVVKKMQADALLFPVEPPKPPKVVVPKVKVVAPPQPPKIEIAKVQPPKIQPPKPEIEPPKPVKLDVPKPVLNIPPAPPKAVAPPPAPKVGMFASNKPTPVANNQSKPQANTGGFGDPHGVAPNPNANRPATIAALGSFNAAPGANSGAGAARKGTVQGVAFGAGVKNGVPGGTSRGAVASAGFKNGVVGGTGVPGGRGLGQAGNANFGNGNIGAGHVQLAQNNVEPAFTPPVVISEPKARYTPEAQEARIQGEVTLQVRFLASGQVEVIRVVNGLGHGLDEEARHVAENIRFKPALRNGQPVDHTTLIHVTFQLA